MQQKKPGINLKVCWPQACDYNLYDNLIPGTSHTTKLIQCLGKENTRTLILQLHQGLESTLTTKGGPACPR